MEAERKSHFKSGTSGFETSASDANGQTVASSE
jgi:hypothetical protein